MQRSKHRSWFRCLCGHTFRSVTHRRRGLRRCSSCQLQAEHTPVVPPNATDRTILEAESRVLEAALATAHCWRGGYSWQLRQCLDALRSAEHDYRVKAFAGQHPHSTTPAPWQQRS